MQNGISTIKLSLKNDYIATEALLVTAKDRCYIFELSVKCRCVVATTKMPK